MKNETFLTKLSESVLLFCVKYWLLLTLGGAYLILSANIGNLDIYALDEARNAGCAYEMWKKGEYIVPTFNNQLRVEKPPLHYYFMILGYSIFGFNEFAARFFSVIFGVLTIGLTYLFAHRYLNPKAAKIASLIMLGSLHFSIQIHMAVPDPYLIFFIAAALMAFYRGFAENQKRFHFLAYLFVGLGFLTKGPIALVFPAITILLFLYSTGQLSWKNLFSFKPFLGLGLVLLVIAPWHIMVGIATQGEWLRGFYLTHNLQRFVEPMEGHGGLFVLTWLYVFLGMLPIGIYIFPAFYSLWKNRNQTQHQAVVFAGIAALVMILFFSFSQTKLPNYTVPTYPFIALVMAYYLQNIFEKNIVNKVVKISTYLYIFIMLLLQAGLIIALQADKYLAHLTHVAAYFFIFPLSGMLAAYFLKQSQFRLLFFNQIITFILANFIFFYIAFPKIDAENPIRKSLRQVNPKATFVAYKIFNPAFVFYLQKEIKVYENLNDLTIALEEIKDREVYVIGRTDAEMELKQIASLKFVAKHKDIFENPTTIILKKMNALSSLPQEQILP
jgi:4-amino-4-deoxy-L-arabinose transferase-like glycosyltransferase